LENHINAKRLKQRAFTKMKSDQEGAGMSAYICYSECV